jgi:hypothetical protein
MIFEEFSKLFSIFSCFLKTGDLLQSFFWKIFFTNWQKLGTKKKSLA